MEQPLLLLTGLLAKMANTSKMAVKMAAISKMADNSVLKVTMGVQPVDQSPSTGPCRVVHAGWVLQSSRHSPFRDLKTLKLLSFKISLDLLILFLIFEKEYLFICNILIS